MMDEVKFASDLIYWLRFAGISVEVKGQTKGLMLEDRNKYLL